MKVIFLHITVLLSLLAFTQELEQNVISSGGGEGSSGSVSLHYTIGEVIVITGESFTSDLTQGFHQPEIKMDTIINNPGNPTTPFENNLVWLPTIFSPNGDGDNDVLYVRGKHIKELNFSVFNRWGNRVYASENLNDGWDGTHMGKPVEDGVFVYQLQVVFVDGSKDERSGSITLIR